MTNIPEQLPVPVDFPRDVSIAALAGAQPKIAVRLDSASGRYVSGQTSAELAERHYICEDLAQQVVAKCRKNRSEKYAALTEVQILDRLLKQLLTTNWGSDEEMMWVIRRAAAILQWQTPDRAIPRAVGATSGASSQGNSPC